MPLNAQQAAAVRIADAGGVVRKFAALPKNWQRNRWLASNNRYANDTVNKLTTDTQAGAQVRHADLGSYIAASAVIHCMDGWSYLSRAMDAELVGDVDAVRHLGYYAELRAAMSLLAGVGIGVFSNRHFSLKADLKCERVSGKIGTHVFVWEALEHWSQQAGATDVILETICPGGKPLTEWMQHFAPTSGGAFRGVIAQFWLKEWGLDLQRLARDHIDRNEASYRPTYMAPRQRHDLSASLNFLESFWKGYEPIVADPFRILDRFLLRNSLAFAFKNTNGGRSAASAPRKFGRLVEPMLHAILPTPGDYSEEQWLRHFDFATPVDEMPLLVLANMRDDIDSPTHHMQVVARSTVLLRVASGAARKLLSTVAAHEKAMLRFWWHPLGESRGLWDHAGPPAPLLDLWGDIDGCLGRLAAWRAGGSHSRRAMLSAVPEFARWLTSCERVGLWGLGL